MKRLCLAAAIACSIVACSNNAQTPTEERKPPTGAAAPAASASNAAPEAPSPYDALPDDTRILLDKIFVGDFDEMVKRRFIRAGVVFNRTQYFVDRGVQRGMAYESLKLFEEQVNIKGKTGLLQVHVVFVPLPRDQLLPALVTGKVDLVTAQLTVTPERERLVDFSRPTRTGVSEVVVTKSGAAPISSAEDLSGRTVFVRKSSSYFESLTRLNSELAAQKRPAVNIELAPEELEDDDILEMVNAGLVEATVIDDFVVKLWKQAFTDLEVHDKATLASAGNIGVAVRKNNPQLMAAVNKWIEEYGPRTTFGNVLDRRYLLDGTYVKRAADQAERKKFDAMLQVFRTYSNKYDLDFLLMIAQGYQESRLDNTVKSRVGAIGVMQVMPATGKELNVGDIKKLEANIHAGVKYVRLMMDKYYHDDPMDGRNKLLMTLASYNAGPGRIRQLRQEAEKRGLNPNVWFGNVERIASERIGRETVQYVSNIHKYAVAYKLLLKQAEDRAQLKARDKEQ
jgi:membrane-bound lytic murein transglycosylase MltF